eukprot:SAG25_NODE_6156_length_583_cov_1.280992_1_plen_52_part_10
MKFLGNRKQDRCYGSLAVGVVGTSIMSQKHFHCTVAHGPKLALRGVTSHLVT